MVVAPPGATAASLLSFIASKGITMKVKSLKDHAHFHPHFVAHTVFGGQVNAVNYYFAGSRLFQLIQAAQKCAFSRTARPDYHHYFLFGHVAVDAF